MKVLFSVKRSANVHTLKPVRNRTSFILIFKRYLKGKETQNTGGPYQPYPSRVTWN